MAQEQPLYDRPDFFMTYLTLPRQQLGHDGAPEWPTLSEMVGPVSNQHALDLGCGLGWFARYAVESNATAVDASDISSKMIAKARDLTPEEMAAKIKYEIADLNSIELEKETYNVVYSSLAFHYLSNESFTRLLHQVHQSLKPGGRFVFSVEHPIFTAPSNPEIQKLPDGNEIWPLNQYALEGLRETNWLGGVRKYHRTMTTYLKGLIDAGFNIGDFVEWMAVKKDVDMYPDWKAERNRPLFLLIKAEKV